MGRVKVILREPLAAMFGSSGLEPVPLEAEIGENATLGDVLTGIAAKNQAFGEAVLDVRRENLGGLICVALNGHLLGMKNEFGTHLRDGDTIMLFPTIQGG